MIISAEEFIFLRESRNPDEYHRAIYEEAIEGVWETIIQKYPDYKMWVIINKKVPIHILETLSADPDPDVRECVARKRKITESIFIRLAVDSSESVRSALLSNTKLAIAQKKMVKTDDSPWLTEQLETLLRNI